ncbi:hypothetical protein [Nocardia rhizosphaerae]|uniref:Lsr2 protein n=1 Tax=Nocardia rhizosphaerae TaxID=1691571 RepID=A0ABV8L239_9NOCA
MTARREVTPEMQAWIDEQMKHFRLPEDMEPAVRLMRQYAREARKNQESAA